MKIKYYSWLPAVLIMVMIFSFSSKTAEFSKESSLTVTNAFLSLYENISDCGFHEEKRMEVLEMMDFIVRKGAHFTEYALLAVAIAFPLRLRKLKGYQLALSSIAFTVCYAVTDEFHQVFVPGRSGEFRDVLIDTAGAVTGFLIFCAVKTLAAKIKIRCGINPKE